MMRACAPLRSSRVDERREARRGLHPPLTTHAKPARIDGARAPMRSSAHFVGFAACAIAIARFTRSRAAGPTEARRASGEAPREKT